MNLDQITVAVYKSGVENPYRVFVKEQLDHIKIKGKLSLKVFDDGVEVLEIRVDKLY